MDRFLNFQLDMAIESFIYEDFYGYAQEADIGKALSNIGTKIANGVKAIGQKIMQIINGIIQMIMRKRVKLEPNASLAIHEIDDLSVLLTKIPSYSSVIGKDFDDAFDRLADIKVEVHKHYERVASLTGNDDTVSYSTNAAGMSVDAAVKILNKAKSRIISLSSALANNPYHQYNERGSVAERSFDEENHFKGDEVNLEKGTAYATQLQKIYNEAASAIAMASKMIANTMKDANLDTSKIKQD